MSVRSVLAGVLGGAVAVGGVGAAVAGPMLVSANQTSTVLACANKASGALRMVNSHSQCRRTETPVSWAVQGPRGVSGAVGSAGAVGEVGPAGPSGSQGTMGPMGPMGMMGLMGPAGIGMNGAIGATGPAGPAGPTGPAGETGAEGAIGPSGPAGETGPTGPTGPAGSSGSGSDVYSASMEYSLPLLANTAQTIITIASVPAGDYVASFTGTALSSDPNGFNVSCDTYTGDAGAPTTITRARSGGSTASDATPMTSQGVFSLADSANVWVACTSLTTQALIGGSANLRLTPRTQTSLEGVKYSNVYSTTAGASVTLSDTAQTLGSTLSVAPGSYLVSLTGFFSSRDGEAFRASCTIKYATSLDNLSTSLVLATAVTFGSGGDVQPIARRISFVNSGSEPISVWVSCIRTSGNAFVSSYTALTLTPTTAGTTSVSAVQAVELAAGATGTILGVNDVSAGAYVASLTASTFGIQGAPFTGRCYLFTGDPLSPTSLGATRSSGEMLAKSTSIALQAAFQISSKSNVWVSCTAFSTNGYTVSSNANLSLVPVSAIR